MWISSYVDEKCIDKNWLDLRVFYVRMSSCPFQKCPQFLSLHLLPRDFSVGLEVNGEHIAHSEIVASVLQRDRIDEESDEVTYVSTDSVRTTGLLRFEVYYKESLVICAKLERLYTGIEDFEKDEELEWSMDCSAAFRLVDWVSLRRSSELRPWSDSTPVMEVYVAGCSFERPVIFTKRLELVCRRNVGEREGAGRPCLVAIAEDEEIKKTCESRARRDALFQLNDCSDGEDLEENVRPAFTDYDPVTNLFTNFGVPKQDNIDKKHPNPVGKQWGKRSVWTDRFYTFRQSN
ncbi:hypothetical protein SUGI_0496600 [Cryptomeria japonica]|nr:hypothetical protein SUGI_0496600 [Cryptomeria japonica]